MTLTNISIQYQTFGTACLKLKKRFNERFMFNLTLNRVAEDGDTCRFGNRWRNNSKMITYGLLKLVIDVIVQFLCKANS